jgi:hypothetical protein
MSVINKFLFTILLFINASILFSQSNIKLNIFDENKEPISYANIVLYDSNDNIITGTTSLNGIAVFKDITKNDYTLCITYIGYKDYCISIVYDNKKELEFIINLVPNATMLNEIAITAKKPAITINSENNISVNIENSKLKEAEDIIELLKYMPGVIVTSKEITEGGIEVFGSTDYIFMINGKEVLSKQEIAILKPEDIKNIEIITSNAKLDATKKYAINFNTIKRKNFFGLQIYDCLEHNKSMENNTKLSLILNRNKIQHSLSLNNSFGTYKQSEVDDIKIFFNQNDIYKINLDTETTMKGIYNDLYYGINYDIDTNQYVGLQLYGHISQPKENVETKSIISDTNFYFNQTVKTAMNYNFQTSVNYFYKMQKSGELFFVADYYTQNVNENMDIAENQRNYYGIGSENRYDIYALKGDYTFPVLKIKTKTSVGFKLYRTDNKNISIPDTLFADDIFNNKNELTEQSAASYLQFNTSLKKIAISGGLRAEYYYKKVKEILKDAETLKRKTDFFPNLSITYNISDKNILMLNYSRNINRQAYNDISGGNSYINPYFYKVSNINIKPTIINSVSFAYIFAGFLQIQAGYSNKKNHTNLYCSLKDSIIIARDENFNKQDLNLGMSATMNGKRHHTTIEVGFAKTFIDYPNELDRLDFPKINFIASLNNMFNITQNFTSIFSFTYSPKRQYDWIITDPYLNISLGLRHFFFNRSLRFSVYYNYNTIDKYISRFNNIEQYKIFSRGSHIFTFTVLYKYKFNQKWVENKNSIETEKQRIP